MKGARRARVRALAKVNLDLRVLEKRPDGYHEIRTVYQTISLADILEISFTPAASSSVQVSSNVDIAENLIEKAALAVDVRGKVEVRLTKRIPMGAGLGGGSSDAAAMLLALPVLAGRRMAAEELLRMAEELGSDVPFFLLGGRALGIGRGSEIYPLPDLKSQPALVLMGREPMATGMAYAALTGLTSKDKQNKIVSFESQAWRKTNPGGRTPGGQNDFERVVFEQFPQLAEDQQRLRKAGASFVLMSGSGSAIFALFEAQAAVRRAQKVFGSDRTFPVRLVSRAGYQAMWRRWLAPHLSNHAWPPRSRYAQ